MARHRRRTRRPETPTSEVLAGVAARMAQVVAWIHAGQWHAPSSPDAGSDADDDDDGGLAPSASARCRRTTQGPARSPCRSRAAIRTNAGR